jgi:hypothetical protein
VRRIAALPLLPPHWEGLHPPIQPQPQRPPPPVQPKLAMTGPAELVTCDQTIERLMNRRKQFRAVATRFDKLAVRYQATVCVADIFIWLRARPDRTRDDPRNTPQSVEMILELGQSAGGADGRALDADRFQ